MSALNIFRKAVIVAGILGTSMGIIEPLRISVSQMAMLILSVLCIFNLLSFSCVKLKLDSLVVFTVMFVSLIIAIVHNKNLALIHFLLPVLSVSRLSAFATQNKALLIEAYLLAAKLAVVVALLQLVAITLDFLDYFDIIIGNYFAAELTFSANMPRIYSMFTEPSFFGLAITPFIWLSTFRRNKAWLLLSVIALILTSSALAFAANLCIIAVLIIFDRDTHKVKFLKLVLLSVVVILMVSNDAVSSRFTGVFSGISLQNIDKTNLSSLLHLLSFYIIFDSFDAQNWIGYGIGSTSDYLKSILKEDTILYTINELYHGQINLGDGGNLFARLSIEAGIIGIFIVVTWFVYRIKIYTQTFQKTGNYLPVVFMISAVFFYLRIGQYLRFEPLLFLVLAAQLNKRSLND